MELLKRGSKGSNVHSMQVLLREKGFHVDTDGIFGSDTEKAIKKFQKSVGLSSDGIVGNMTWTALYGNPTTIYDSKLNIDLTEYHLRSNEYYKEVVEKDTIYLHHTAGGSRPDYVIDGWERDNNRRGGVLRVGTAFLIGGATNGSPEFDGKIYTAFNERYWAHHLGLRLGKDAKYSNKYLNQKSIGIEICNYGFLEKIDDEFYFDAGRIKIFVPSDEVIELDEPWRNKRYFHKYSEKQIESLRLLLIELIEKYDINIQHEVFDRSFFDFNQDSIDGVPGLWTHSNCRIDKTDCSPQHILIDMLNTL